MPPRIVLRLVAALTLVAYVAGAALRGDATPTLTGVLAPIAPAVLISGAALWLFDRHLWRWGPLRGLIGRPVLHGTWHGVLQSDFVRDGQRIPPIDDVFLVVEQRYWQVRVSQYTAESRSHSVTAAFTQGPDGGGRLLFTYTNEPDDPEVLKRSPRHYGTALLDAPRDTTAGIRGRYFTDRSTTGTLTFATRHRARIESHAAGLALARG